MQNINKQIYKKHRNLGKKKWGKRKIGQKNSLELEFPLNFFQVDVTHINMDQ